MVNNISPCTDSMRCSDHSFRPAFCHPHMLHSSESSSEPVFLTELTVKLVKQVFPLLSTHSFSNVFKYTFWHILEKYHPLRETIKQKSKRKEDKATDPWTS